MSYTINFYIFFKLKNLAWANIRRTLEPWFPPVCLQTVTCLSRFALMNTKETLRTAVALSRERFFFLGLSQKNKKYNGFGKTCRGLGLSLLHLVPPFQNINQSYPDIYHGFTNLKRPQTHRSWPLHIYHVRINSLSKKEFFSNQKNQKKKRIKKNKNSQKI